MPKLTKRVVDATHSREKDYVIWDDELPGFGLRVFASGKRSYVIPTGEVALVAVIASVAGAITASVRQGRLRFQRPTAAGILRSIAGGALMGIGIGLIPGGNDALILAAMPTLSPGGIVAYLVMTTTIGSCLGSGRNCLAA